MPESRSPVDSRTSRNRATPPLVRADFPDFVQFVEKAARRFDGTRMTLATSPLPDAGQRVRVEVYAGSDHPVLAGLAVAALPQTRRDAERTFEFLFLDPAARALLRGIARYSKLPPKPTKDLGEIRTQGTSVVPELRELAGEFDELLAQLDPRRQEVADRLRKAREPQEPTPRTTGTPPGAVPVPSDPTPESAASPPDGDDTAPDGTRTPERGSTARPEAASAPAAVEPIPRLGAEDPGQGGLFWGILAVLTVLFCGLLWTLRGQAPPDGGPTGAASPVVVVESVPPASPEPSVGREPNPLEGPSVTEEPEAEVPAPSLVPEGPTDPETTSPDPAAPSPPPTAATIVEGRVADWARAWSSGDPETYLTFYSERFLPARGTREEWAATRHERLTAPEWIEIEVSDLEIAAGGDRAVARFVQSYSRPGYADEVAKTLEWAREDDAVWRILAERSE